MDRFAEDQMDRRGGKTLALFVVLNPILIMFFQNCSVVPIASTQASNQAYSQFSSPSSLRSLSSVQDVESCKLVSSHKCAE